MIALAVIISQERGNKFTLDEPKQYALSLYWTKPVICLSPTIQSKVIFQLLIKMAVDGNPTDRQGIALHNYFDKMLYFTTYLGSKFYDSNISITR